MLQHIGLNLLIGGVVQDAGGVQVFQREFDPDAFALNIALGKLNHRLHVVDPAEHIQLHPTVAILVQIGIYLDENYLLSART